MSEKKPFRIFMAAGEQSGDLHGSLILAELKKLDPTIVAEGIGGPMMEKQGFKCLHSIDELGVIGFVEVVSNLGRLLKIFGDAKRHFRENKPDMLILIDYPGFNVRLAQAAKACGIKVLYYICPQVWAWNPGRTAKIADTIDEAVVVFQFEVDIWKKTGTKVNWFGHPLVGIVESRISASQLREELEITDGPLISLLPGSRSQEIYYILPLLLDTAEKILLKKPRARFLLPMAASIDESKIRPHLSGRSLPITLMRDQTYESILASDLALVASGTATLETALLGTPMIIVYQTNFLTSILSKFLIQAPHIGLPNVIAGEKIVPEYLRWQFQPEPLAAEAISILENDEMQKIMREKLSKVREKLGDPGAAERVARHILNQLESVEKSS
ncbi:MAG: lipid-A-disaccharide synthase [Candidatus Riflebacteria bacterium]|nr:lipid-A-disaccharide synthase [Candidatus Riflebacteria bacterium]